MNYPAVRDALRCIAVGCAMTMLYLPRNRGLQIGAYGLSGFWGRAALCLCLALLGTTAAQAQLNTLEQASNGTPEVPVSAVDWVSSTITVQRGHYVEGSSIPYRLVLTPLVPGAHRAIIAWDTKINGRHNIDYLTFYNRLQPHNQFGAHNVPETIQPTRSLSGGFQGPSTVAIPVPSTLPGSSFNLLPPNQRVLHIYNGTITSASYVTEGSLGQANAETRLAIDFTATDTAIAILFGGHLATKAEWGAGQTASGIVGQQYRMRLVELDGLPTSLNVAVDAPAVVAPPMCDISGPDPVCPGTTNTYAVATDAAGASFTWTFTANTAGASIIGPSTGPTVQVYSGSGGGTFNLQVAINAGPLQSACARSVNVLTNVTITPLVNVSTCPEGTATFATQPSGTGPFLFRWSKDGQVIEGQNTKQLTISNVTAATAGKYCVEVSGACNSTASCANLTVFSNTTATALANLTRCVGDGAVFTTTASGAGPFRYRWLKNGSEIPSQTNRIFTIGTLTFNDGGTYTVEVYGLCNSVTNSGTLTIVGLPPCNIQGPSIICPSSSANVFTAPANFAGYRWRVTGNGSIIGQTNQAAVTVAGTTAGFLTLNLTVINSNACSRSCSLTITVGDTQPPTIVCPQNIETNTAPGQCSRVVQFAVGATDDCGGATTTCTPPSGGQFQKGTTTVNCTAMDAAGNQAACSFNVTVIDVEKPRLTWPTNLVINTRPGGCDAVVNFGVTVADNCPGTTLSCSPPSGTIFPLGTSSVTCRASDAAGNVESCAFDVTVVDTEAPQINCPADLILLTDPGQCDVMVDFQVQATDNCAAANLVCIPPSGSLFSRGITTVTCTATDVSHNSSQCSFQVQVDDGEKPRMVCPADISVFAEPSRCDAHVNFTYKTGDNCPDVTVSCVPPANTHFPLGHTTVTCTATDDSGNTSTCSFKVTVSDNQRPVLTCPQDLLVRMDPGRCTAMVQYTNSVTDNCLGARVECVPPPGSVFSAGLTVVNCVASDTSSNTVSCAFNVVVQDEELPQLFCPTHITTNAPQGQCAATVNFNLSATDNCPGVQIVCGPESGSVFPVGETLVFCLALDTAGNVQDCMFSVIVSDTERPVIACPPDLTLNTATGRCDAVATFNVTATDNCGSGPVSCTPPSGSTFAKGTNSVNCTATDAGGNTAACAFRVIVQDREPPVIACPANIFTNTSPGRCDALVPFAPLVSDNCEASTLLCSPPSGTRFAIGATPVTCVATDASGNTNRCSFSVTVTDNELPAITCPANIVTSTEPGRCDAVVTFAPSVSDNCALASTTCAPPSGTRFSKGTTPVICTARDGSGNERSCSFIVTVNDTDPPVITCPTNQVVAAEPGRCDATVSFAPAVNDNCASATIVCSPASGTRFAVGQTLVTCVATDASGNTNRCTFTITVQDREKPVITCPANILTSTESARCDARVTFSVAASDNCALASTSCAPPSGTRFNKGTTLVVCTARDTAGNEQTCSFTVTVNDNEPPAITCPTNQIVSAEPGRCDAVASFSPGFSDNCGGATLVCSPPSGTRFVVGETPVTCVATDAAGNTNQCRFSVIVRDQQQPQVVCPDDIVAVTAPGTCDAQVTFTAAVSDNCPGVTAQCVPPSGSHFARGATIVACTATDASGNVAACAFTVTVNDSQPPSITCPTNIVVNTATGRCDAVVSYAVTVADNCSGASVVCTPQSGSTFVPGVTPVNCVATDTSGNTNRCSFTVTVQDRQKPLITCPQSQVVFTSAGHCDAVATFTASATDNCDGVTVTCVPSSGSRFPNGVNTITCTATDSAGNTDSCSFTVTVRDLEPPVLTCPTNIVAGMDTGRCDAIITFAPTVVEECPGGSVVCVPPSGTRFAAGNTPVNCTATDASSNSVTCSFTVQVLDRENPRVVCPGNIVTNNATGRCNAVVSFAPGVTDNCAGSSVVCEPPSGSAFAVGTNSVVCIGTDSSGNEDFCAFTVTVLDTERPSITCPANITVNTEPGRCDAAVTFAASATDNCSQTVVCVPPSGSRFNKGVRSVNCTATDPSGNSATCTFMVTVRDNELPVIVCPTNMTLHTQLDACSVRATFSAQVTDNCPGATIVCVPPSNSEFPIGTTTVVCQGADAAGNARLCAFDVVVIDTEPPRLTCPGDLIVDAEPTQCTATVAYSVSGTDACGLTNLVCVPASGSLFSKGVTSVHCSARDASGNEATCTFNVTVRDMEAPTLLCPTNVVVAATTGRCDAPVQFDVSYSDNCPSSTIVCVPQSGSTFQVGTTFVNCTATDAAGNTNRCTFSVRVIDNQRPVLTCSSNLVVDCETNRCDAIVTFATSATDNCGAMSITCAPPSGSRFGLGSTPVACSSTDAAGNTGTCSFTVTVRDNQKPVLQCPANIVTPAFADQCDAVVTFTVPASDNCSAVNGSCFPPSGSVFPLGTTTVSCSAADGYANIGTCQFTVTVQDLEGPSLQCPADIYANTVTGRCDAVVSFTPQVSDNCAIADITCTPPSGTTFPKGTNTVTCTARDTSNNSVACSFRVIVRDIEKPQIICPGDRVVSAEASQCRARVTYSATATDNCPGATMVCNPPSNSFFNKGVTTVICVATDSSGNTNRCSFTVTVLDTTPPSITCPANIVTNAIPGQTSAVVQFTPVVSDNCSGLSFVCSPQSGSVFQQGATPVTCIATDSSGNTNRCSFTVTVNDTEPPVINCPTNLVLATTLGRCDAVCNYTVTASDNSQMVTVVCVPPSGSVLPKGLTDVLCTATDPSSNSVSCAFNITVVDLEKPVITCGTNMIVGTDHGRCDARVSYGVKVTDNCGAASIVCTPPSDALFPKGTNLVTCTATDSSGNVETCAFTVRVVDYDAPVLVCPTNMVVILPPGQCDVAVSYNTSVTDNCPGTTVSCSPPTGSILGKGVVNVNCTARDSSGNTASCGFSVNVRDQESPVITCPGDITLPNYPGSCGAPVSYSAMVRDNCPGATLSCNPPSGSMMPVGTNIVTCTAVDASSNTASCTFRVTIRDVESPVVTCPGDIVIDGSNGICTTVATYSATVRDNCPGTTLACMPPSGTTFAQGTNHVLCTAVDASGNMSSCVFSVIVRLQPLTATPLQSLTRCAGETATFATSPGGSGPFAFTWLKNGLVMSGRTNSSLVLSNLAAGNSGTYTVVVQSPCSNVTNSATLQVNTPVVISGMTNVTRCNCDPLVLSPLVTGSGPLSYVWRKNGSVVPGATSNSLAFSKLTTNDVGVYSVEVSGACNTATASATVGVIAVPNPAVYTNGGTITIQDHAPAFPYPSSVHVVCVPQAVKRATVTLRGFTHAYPDDVDVMLAAPDGRCVMLMSDAGDGSLANNVNITLDDSAALPLPDATQLVTGTYRPGNYDTDSDAFPSPAPKLTPASTLSALAGTDPNGFWSLFVVDDFQLDAGAINNGWVLRLYWESSPVMLSAPRMLANGAFQMTVTGDAGTTYAIQASTDLRTWTQVGNVTLTGAQATFTDQSPHRTCFYRATQP